MSHKLILEVPKEVYDPLVGTAKRIGATPEALAVEWLAAASVHAIADPLEKFIGAIPSNVPDWTERHDQYFGEALTRSNSATRAAT